MRGKRCWFVVFLSFAMGCEQFLGEPPHRLWECPMIREACVCGDNLVSADLGEQCDDGNAKSLDGCSSSCQREAVTSIVAGAFHTCALVTGGSVKCWGRNDFGQLGIGDRAHRGDHADEREGRWPGVALGEGRSAVALAAGDFHTCALLDDASVKCWGLNGIGQLGLGDLQNRGDDPNEMGDALLNVLTGMGVEAQQITAGTLHTCVLLGDGRVACWGANASGQLGLGNTESRNGLSSLNVTSSVVDLGAQRYATQLEVGGYFTCVRLDNGTLKCWGQNRLGQLGLGDTADRGNSADQMGGHLPSFEPGGGVPVLSLALGHAHACALLDYGYVKCWGGNEHGQLGLGDTAQRDAPVLPVVDLGTKLVSHIATGLAHTCVVSTDGAVTCWGRNDAGQLGIGDRLDRGDEPGEVPNGLPAVALGQQAVMVAAGQTHTCALLADTSVVCWGGNTFGQLGMGDTQNRGDGSGATVGAVKVIVDH